MTAEASVEEGGRFTHSRASERWGEPDEWEGSVNDPRTREEHGIRFNERWTYLLPDGSCRIVYWHRYDFRGARRVYADGRVEEEPV